MLEFKLNYVSKRGPWDHRQITSYMFADFE